MRRAADDDDSFAPSYGGTPSGHVLEELLEP